MKNIFERTTPVGDCLIWTGAKNNCGYGSVRFGKKVMLAHRAAYMLSNNCEIPEKMCVMHSCDNPSCINPSHLRLGSQAENIKDMMKKGRNDFSKACPEKKSQTHCIHGHEFTEENTRYRIRNSRSVTRQCRACGH